ncbi:nucleotidyltransferase domain-containing protein [Kitasatospora sp. NPDC089509]|uniref:nucleotidyltransferase domain-containing protein n=1 Tax=Kitasatospora sp. NPDC089509 TaxID=3364079 RepID=UPI0037F50C73
MLDLLKGAGAAAWVDGGWGVDALLGETTRIHSDLDLVVLFHQLDVVRDALVEAGFTKVLRDWLPSALAVADSAGREIDLHPIVGSSREGGQQFLPGGERFRYPAPVTGTIGGRQVLCVDAATQVRCHLGYEATDKDRQDMARLHAGTGVELPLDYAYALKAAVPILRAVGRTGVSIG